jgi:5'-nucleotidase/UDP-sugar diphosphatase
VISVEVMDAGKMVALDPAKTYNVVTNNYVRGGGDGYKVFAEKGKNAYDFGPSLEDTTAAYLGKNSPYKPFTDGRITIVESAVPATTETTTDPAAPETKTETTGGEVKTPDLPAAATDIASQPPVVQQNAAESKQTTTSEGAEATSNQATTEQKHTLAKGDNFWNLAKQAYGDGALWKKISDANPGLRPRALPVGKEITVPAK